MHRLTFWLVVLVYLFASVQGCGFARDEGTIRQFNAQAVG